MLAALERHLALRWIRAGERAAAPLAPSTRESEPAPPADLLARLVELSRSGDIAGVNALVAELERRGRHPRLVSALQAFARTFDMKAIRDLLHGIESSA